MKNGRLDDYVATFDELVQRAGWERNTHGTLNLFKQGLPVYLHRAVLARENLPQNLDEWIASCRMEVQRSALKRSSLGPTGGRGDISTRRNLMKGYDSRPTKSRRERDPDAMEVDALKTDKLSKEEREKLSKEGRCFQCKKQGHMSRDCPDKKKKSDKEPKRNDKDKGATK